MYYNSRDMQIIRNIAVLIWDKPDKLAQLEKVQDISIHLTSDDGLRIMCEVYAGNVVRYLVQGTRSGMTITANSITREMMRKPRNSKPVYRKETYCIFAGDIMKQAAEIRSHHEQIEGR